MAKKKVVNTTLDQNLNGTNFNNTASETIFQFGSFAVTSNFDGRKYIDYSNVLSSFVRPVTLETLGVNEVQSAVLLQKQVNATLNLDKSNLNTYVKFGSTYEFFRVATQEIITKYPGSLFANSNVIPSGNISVYNINYDSITNITTFNVPSPCIINKFGLIYNVGNTSEPDNMAIKNVNNSYLNYVVWSKYNPDNSYPVIAFTGDTPNTSAPYLTIKTLGNPFPFNSGATGYFDFHIKPNNLIFEEYRTSLSDYEKYIVGTRDGLSGFKFNVSDPTLLDDGNIVYSTVALLWTTGDGYNLDIDNSTYQRFLNGFLTIGAKYDTVKTDLIARFLTPSSLKTYDLTQDGKMSKLLRVYGWEFDQLKKFIDSLVNINTVTYNKLNNIPDQLVSNLAKTLGWDYFALVNEEQLVNNFFSIDDKERNLDTDLLPAEVNIELWRRILMNTNYFWKSKGTRQAIKSIFLLIGIPEPFINITEYVYTVNGKINPNTVPFGVSDFPNSSLPYDNSGYPVAPLESPTFYFQVSGDTDSGQAYMDNFRKAGFSLMRTADNKKSWIQTGATTRIHSTTPQYYQGDSKLVLNTKEIDVALDTARGIEYDVYDYIQKDFAANSSGYTMPFSYVNISLGVSGIQNTFSILPPGSNVRSQGDFEVRFNGILLNAPKTGTTTGITAQADYTIDYVNNTFTLVGGSARAIGNQRDVVQVTFITSGGTHSVTGISVNYVVTRVKAELGGTKVPLPGFPRGDVQVTINGIALTKGTGQFTADYVLDPTNSSGSTTNNIIIQNPEVISYLATNPEVQIAYIEVDGNSDIAARRELLRVDSFSSSKLYYNASANKYVYKLNYKANDARDLKILLNGIALEPNMDYQINQQNLYEVFLPKGIKLGTIISVYYIVGGSSIFNPIVTDRFGVGDISKLSFLEFIELIQRRLINARTRKTVTDFKGGWYPSLLNVYTQYLIRGQLPENNPLHSNGYTFENLYPFLSKYNSFFNRFVDQLLSATIILKQSGLLVRNTVFSKQKFAYKRGVNLYLTDSTTLDMRGLPMVQYLGDDGSTFMIAQNVVIPPPNPPTLGISTVAGTPGIGSIIGFGGNNILNYTLMTEYGMEFRKVGTAVWTVINEPGAPTNGQFVMSAIGLEEGVQYEYKAYVKYDDLIAFGDTLTITTDATQIITSLTTKPGSVTTTTIATGAQNVIKSGPDDWYGMQFSLNGNTWTTAPLVAGPLVGTSYDFTITGLNPQTAYYYRAYISIAGTVTYGNTLQITTSALPVYAPTVTTSTVTDITKITATAGGNVTNDGGATVTERGVVWGYVPNLTTANNKVVMGSGTGVFSGQITGLNENTTYYVRAYAINSQGTSYGTSVSMQTLASPTISMLNIYGADNNGVSDAWNAGRLSNNSSPYQLTLGWSFYKGGATTAPYGTTVEVYKNGSLVDSKTCVCKAASINWTGPTSGSFTPISVGVGDVIDVCVCAQVAGSTQGSSAVGSIWNVTGGYAIGSPRSICAYTCGAGRPILED